MPTVNCSSCNKQFKRRNYYGRESKNVFCSRYCKGKWMAGQVGRNTPRWIHNRFNAACHVCNKTYHETPSKIKRNKNNFCSNECYRVWQREEKTKHPSQQKLIKIDCAQCGKTIERQPYQIKITKNSFCNFSCRSHWVSENMSGKNSSGWRGGNDSYYGPNWKRQRQEALKRDNYTCQHCQVAEKDLRGQLHVHHIKPFKSFSYLPGSNHNYKQANKLNNLISLCPSCHAKAEPENVIIQLALLSQSAARVKAEIAKNRLEKQCYRCKAIKPLTQFHKDKNRPDQHYTYCKQCVKQYQAK